MLSLDTLLGLIGGFVGLIWSVVTYGLGGYEEFRFIQEIISEVYSTTDQERMVPDKEPTDYEAARKDLTRSLESKRRYDYFYLDFLSAYLLQCCCCCFKKRKCFKKRAKRLRRHELAME